MEFVLELTRWNSRGLAYVLLFIRWKLRGLAPIWTNWTDESTARNGQQGFRLWFSPRLSKGDLLFQLMCLTT